MPALETVKVVNPKDETKSVLVNEIEIAKNPTKYTLWKDRKVTEPAVKEPKEESPKKITRRTRKKNKATEALRQSVESVASETGDFLDDANEIN